MLQLERRGMGLGSDGIHSIVFTLEVPPSEGQQGTPSILGPAR